MKFSKDISKAVTSVMALFQKQLCCSSNKATTICGQAAESLRRVPVRAQSGRCCYRKQSAVCASHNVPSDTPTLVEFVGNGSYTDNYVYASILVGCAEEIAPGAIVDDIFPAFYNSDAFINTFKSFSRATYAEFIPATTEAVTINGYDAIKFTGVQEADDYGTARTYDVYGYCAVINDLPIIVVGVTEQGKDQDTEELRAEQIHYVDEMIQTARVTPW